MTVRKMEDDGSKNLPLSDFADPKRKPIAVWFGAYRVVVSTRSFLRFRIWLTLHCSWTNHWGEFED